MLNSCNGATNPIIIGFVSSTVISLIDFRFKSLFTKISFTALITTPQKGKIKVESTLGKGSCFTIEIPRVV